MEDETMLARIPASKRLAWRVADALSRMAQGERLERHRHRNVRVVSLVSQPLYDPERRHALYEAACQLESESAIALEPLLDAMEALLEEHGDLHRDAADLREDLEHTAGWRLRFEETRREHAECHRELRQTVGVADDVAFASPQEEWAHLLDRIAALRGLASVAATSDAEAARSDTPHPIKNVWERLRDES